MAAPSDHNVELGFAEKTENWRLLSHFFPSKIGGKPAWLALSSVPGAEVLSCERCGNPCVFLLQVYAPPPSDHMVDESTFHRTLFVFICRNPACYENNHSSPIVVLRSQLAKVNTFYSDSPPEESDLFDWNSEFPSADKHQTLCVLCGCAGGKRCAACHKPSYCGKHHQTLHWKAGHKRECKSSDSSKSAAVAVENLLFPEYDLLTEPEEYKPPPEKTEEEKLREYEEFNKSASDIQIEGVENDKDLEAMAMKEEQSDKQFTAFKERIAHEPDQVLRYHLGGQPLWVSSEEIPKPEDILPCACGSPRQFEFQILPQLLTHLQVDSLEKSIDWGTISVYTCKRSCDSVGQYCREFVWKQDIAASDSV